MSPKVEQKEEHEPVVKDGKLNRLSVSSISKFDVRSRGGCQRKWWFRYVERIEEPPSPVAQLGIDGHARLEAYFRGQAVCLSDCEVPALALLPQPGLARPEVTIEKLTLGGVPLVGSMDLVAGGHVYDYKFQGRIKPFTEPTIQMWGYLEELRLWNNDLLSKFSFTHIYIQRKEPWRAKADTKTFTGQEVAANWAALEPMVDEIKQVASETNGAKVPCNKNACFAYGPCVYLQQCKKLSTESELTSIQNLFNTKGSDMSFLDELSKVKLALPPDAATTTASKEDLPEEPKETAKPKKAKSKLKSLRYGLKIGMPEYSSIEASVEVEGVDETDMHNEAQAILIRRIEALVPVYSQALAIKGGKKP